MKQLNSYLCLGQQIASFSWLVHMSYNWQLIEWRLRFFTHWQMGLDCAKVWNRISITAGTAGKRRWKVKQESDENCCERQVWKVCPRSSAHLCSRVQKVALTSDVYIYNLHMDDGRFTCKIHDIILYSLSPDDEERQWAQCQPTWSSGKQPHLLHRVSNKSTCKWTFPNAQALNVLVSS